MTSRLACAALLVWTSLHAAGSEPGGSTAAAAAPAVVRMGALTPDGRYTVSIVPMETYVARVLAGEALRGSPPASLEALAIAVRTFAVANLGRHRSEGFDLCDQTHCQVARVATPSTERAAQSTAGMLLVKGGVLASIYYTASCGGRTEKPSAVWPGADDPAFLPVQDDDACQGAPAWTAEIRDVDLLRALRAAGFRGDRVLDVRISARTVSGRVASLQIAGLQPSTISGQDLRVAVGRTLGWQYIKSTAFELRRAGNAYRFDGHGSGHGVGLCVIGSARLAERGRTAVEILARYFPGLEIRNGRMATTAASPRPAGSPKSVEALLPDDDQGARVTIETLAFTDRNELARMLGVAAPAVTLRVHSTVDGYERVTGLPWFTAVTAIDNELHLIPLAGLRDRGILDRTIRRGLVHAMVDGPLKDRRAWVREGAALYYGDPQRIAFDGRTTCPADHELLQPVSIGALSTAFARARACFARQIAAGRSWRDVR